MSDVIRLNRVGKKYDRFNLHELTFEIKEGYITLKI
jgi:hypothetical protein